MKFFISCLFLLFSVQIQASKPNTQPKIVWLCNADGTAHCFLDGSGLTKLVAKVNQGLDAQNLGVKMVKFTVL